MKNFALGLFLIVILAGCGDVERDFKDVDVAPHNDPKFLPRPTEAHADGSLKYEDGFKVGPTCQEEGEIKHGSGGAYITRGLLETWGSAQTAEGVKWSGAEQKSWENTPGRLRGGEMFAFYTKDHNHITWEIEWHHRVLEGSADKPQLVKINYTMKKAGKLPFITPIVEWYGVILLRNVAPGVTGFYMDNYISGRASCEDSSGAVKDIFNNLHR